MTATVVEMRSNVDALKRLLRDAVAQEVRSSKLKQGEAARRLGTDRVGLNRMLHGRRMPSLEALLSYADAATSVSITRWKDIPEQGGFEPT